MKKNLIIIFISALILSGLIVLTYSNQDKSLEKEIESCSEDLGCLTKLAIENSNSNICVSLGDKTLALNCSLEVTISKGNMAECGKYRWDQSYCEDRILNK